MANYEFDLDALDKLLDDLPAAPTSMPAQEESVSALATTVDEPKKRWTTSLKGCVDIPQMRRLSTSLKIGQLMNQRLTEIADGSVDLARIWEVSGDISGAPNNAAMDAFKDFMLEQGIEAPDLPDGFTDEHRISGLTVLDMDDGSKGALFFRYWTGQLASHRKELEHKSTVAPGGLPHVQFNKNCMMTRFYSLIAAGPGILNSAGLALSTPLPSYEHMFYDIPEPEPSPEEYFHANLTETVRGAYRQYIGPDISLIA